MGNWHCSESTRKCIGLLALLCAGCVQRESNPNPVAADRVIPAAGQVELGDPRLTAGIPGNGPLALAEINAWLSDDRVHQPLVFVLPDHLADAADAIHVPDDNPLTLAKIELGRQLFFDKRLSGLGTFSCSQCHQPHQSYTSYLVMPEVGRNASTVFNRILSSEQFWDGRAETLEHQPHSPVANPFEMNSSPRQTTAHVKQVEGYAVQFDAIFGEVSFENICRALASFERMIVTGPSAWDYERMSREQTASLNQVTLSAVSNEQHRMSAAALRGEQLFFSKRAGCGVCHTGPNLSDEQYHNLGVGTHADKPDVGRMAVTDRPSDRGAFKTPSLRNVAVTPPYMHNGQFRTLTQVIDFLDAGGQQNEHLSPMLRPLHLSRDEKADLLAFLSTLTSELSKVETGRLPE